MNQIYFEILISLAKKAAKKNEVPVGALIVKDDKILAKAYNKRNKSKSIFDHAEMLVIKKASGKLGDWRLDKCDIYVTLKPCNMCMSAIRQSRIRNVYYLLDKPDNKLEYNKTNIAKVDEQKYASQYQKILHDFFAKKRDK